MDDEDMIGEIACQMLIHLGYDGHHVKDGESAIAEYSRSLEEGAPYDIIIMDLSIPGGMGGKETIGKVLDINPEVKVLVSSGNPGDPIMMQYGDHGFKGAINKPFDLASLQSTLDSLS